MDLKIKNKVALITGASSGIGASTAKVLAQEGADVILTFKNNLKGAKETEKMVNALGRNSWLYRFDMSNPKSVSFTINQLKKKFEQIDILVLCAGEISIVPFEKLEPKEWNAIINVNLNGTFFVLHSLIPLMANESSIVIVSSVSAHTGSPNQAHYAAAKAGLINLTKSASRALAPRIRVNCVAPGITLTSMGRKTIASLERNYRSEKLLVRNYASSEEIAQLITYVVSPISRFMTGATIDINGGRILR